MSDISNLAYNEIACTNPLTPRELDDLCRLLTPPGKSPSPFFVITPSPSKGADGTCRYRVAPGVDIRKVEVFLSFRNAREAQTGTMQEPAPAQIMDARPRAMHEIEDFQEYGFYIRTNHPSAPILRVFEVLNTPADAEAWQHELAAEVAEEYRKSKEPQAAAVESMKWEHLTWKEACKLLEAGQRVERRGHPFHVKSREDGVWMAYRAGETPIVYCPTAEDKEASDWYIPMLRIESGPFEGFPLGIEIGNPPLYVAGVDPYDYGKWPGVTKGADEPGMTVEQIMDLFYREGAISVRREPKTLQAQLAEVINRNSIDNESGTPDFILAQLMVDALTSFRYAVRVRTNVKAVRTGNLTFSECIPALLDGKKIRRRRQGWTKMLCMVGGKLHLCDSGISDEVFSPAEEELKSNDWEILTDYGCSYYDGTRVTLNEPVDLPKSTEEGVPDKEGCEGES